MSEAQHLVLDVDCAGSLRRRPGYTLTHPAGLSSVMSGLPVGARTRVYLYARDAILRDGVASQLRSRATIELLDSGGVDPSGVAVVVADDLHGEVLRAIAGIRRACTARIVVVATHVTPLTTSAAIDAGAWHIIRRVEAHADALVAVIRRAADASGPPADPTEALGDLINRLDADRPAARARPAGLSGRDVEVLRLLGEGLSTAIIARDLAYSESTIKNTVHAIVRRLGARNRAHAVAMAIRSGLIH